jgi:hypothetical protein
MLRTIEMSDDGSMRMVRMNTPSGDEPESEEDYEPETPYPLEGKYIDEDDRQRYAASPITNALCNGLHMCNPAYR